MKYKSNTAWLFSILLLLCGCGGEVKTSRPLSGPPAGPPSGPPVQSLNIVGNWQFSTTSSMTGTSTLTIAGSINQSDREISGAMHVSGSTCIDRMITVGLTGTLNGSNLLLTSSSVDGQVTTITGTVSDTSFTGTYHTNGGCADGDQGSVIGTRIPYIANQLQGTFTNSGQGTFDAVGDIAQNATASSDGSYGITGSVTFNTACFSAGTIKSGTLSSGSFILGSTVGLEVETGNGTVTFLGTLNGERSQIDGDFTISGGTCDGTGTAILNVTSPWDY
jgi:hypothetical protein